LSAGDGLEHVLLPCVGDKTLAVLITLKHAESSIWQSVRRIQCSSHMRARERLHWVFGIPGLSGIDYSSAVSSVHAGTMD